MKVLYDTALLLRILLRILLLIFHVNIRVVFEKFYIRIQGD